tara:strand:- start:1055 stop:1228 length:174 start_codon:yes stop_codon:yes gene_type:complete
MIGYLQQANFRIKSVSPHKFGINGNEWQAAPSFAQFRKPICIPNNIYRHIVVGYHSY